jgi:hypothetical protein
MRTAINLSLSKETISMNTTKTAILAAAIGGLVAFAGPAFSADDSKNAQTESATA